MSYIKNNLLKDEHVVFETSLNKFRLFLWPTIITAFGSLMLFGAFLGKGEAPIMQVAWIFIVGVLMMTGAFLQLWVSDFAVTNKRVVLKSGLIKRDSVELMIGKVEGINLKQGILDRILKSGTIVVNGTGGGKSSFTKIDNPVEFRRNVQEQISELEQRRVA